MGEAEFFFEDAPGFGNEFVVGDGSLFAQGCGHDVGEGSEAFDSVPVFVGVFAVFAGVDDDGEEGEVVVGGARFLEAGVVFLGDGALFDVASEAEGAEVLSHELTVELVVFGEVLHDGLRCAGDPDFLLGVPLHSAVTDVVGRVEAADARGAIAVHAPGVAAVENEGEVDAIGELRVEAVDHLVGDAGFVGPVEVVGDESFFVAFDGHVGIVFGGAGAVAAEVEDELIAGAGVFEEPFDAGEDVGCGGAFVEEDADVVGWESAFLEDGADEEDVVDAAFKTVGGIGVVIDADEEGALAGGGALAGLGEFGEGG